MSDTLLVIDDDDVFRERVMRHLGDVYTLAFAGTIADAHRVLEEYTPDCILLDFRLPDGEGIDFLPMPVEAHIPVVMCTARGSESVAVRALKEGAEDYLVKGTLGKIELRRAIESALERAQLRAMVRQREAEKDLLIRRLQAAMKDIETLHGLIPICAQCKKIRDDDGFWLGVEAYVSKRTGASFTHGYCPECFEKEKNRILEDYTDRSG